MRDYFGYLGKIGHIYPSSGTVAEREIHKVLPEGYSLLTTRILMKRADRDGLKGLLGRLKHASELLATAEVDIICFNCTLAGLIEGEETIDMINSEIEDSTGIRAINTTQSVLKALNTLKSEKILLLTPYRREMNELERRFLESMGFDVVGDFCLGLDDPVLQGCVNPEIWVKKAVEFSGPEFDTVFISCSGVPAIQAIPEIECELNVHTVTSNQALMWHCLRQLGFRGEVKGCGSLFGH